jgi:hypothetical protein
MDTFLVVCSRHWVLLKGNSWKNIGSLLDHKAAWDSGLEMTRNRESSGDFEAGTTARVSCRAVPLRPQLWGRTALCLCQFLHLTLRNQKQATYYGIICEASCQEAEVGGLLSKTRLGSTWGQVTVFWSKPIYVCMDIPQWNPFVQLIYANKTELVSSE